MMAAWNLARQIDVGDVLMRMKDVLGFRTDRELAAYLGVSFVTVSSWRTRNSMPPEAVVFVAREWDISLDWLFLGDL